MPVKGEPLAARNHTVIRGWDYDWSRSSASAAAEPARLLAALPVQLVPGPAPALPPHGPSPLVVSLAVAWIGVLVAGLAVGLLLWQAVALSERRAAFVSAVTHELRTPLTTFRMYSEMLSGGMVTDEAKRRRYLDTLRIEANRLTHLVENVLSYARLERGRARGRVETVRLDDLVGRVRERLSERAAQAGMQLVTEMPDGSGAAGVRADVSAVEQILFNLVDNACKYAATAADRRLHLVAEAAGRPGAPGGLRPRARHLGPRRPAAVPAVHEVGPRCRQLGPRRGAGPGPLAPPGPRDGRRPHPPARPPPTAPASSSPCPQRDVTHVGCVLRTHRPSTVSRDPTGSAPRLRVAANPVACFPKTLMHPSRTASWHRPARLL